MQNCSEECVCVCEKWFKGRCGDGRFWLPIREFVFLNHALSIVIIVHRR